MATEDKFSQNKNNNYENRGGSNKDKFHFGDDEILITNNYRYLGTHINSKGNLSTAKEQLKNKGPQSNVYNVVQYITRENTSSKYSNKII